MAKKLKETFDSGLIGSIKLKIEERIGKNGKKYKVLVDA
jgi:hypothetical protein